MTGERTAVDVLLAVEQRVDAVLHKQNSLDLINKINSTKMTQIETKLDHIIDLINSVPDENGFTMAPENNPHSLATAPPMKIADEYNPPIPMTNETAPVGIRRTSRGEPFSAPHQQKNIPTPSIPTPQMKPPKSLEQPQETNTGSRIVEQRIVDRNSKAIFKADVEVVDANGITVSKTQTSIMGKWNATLAPGKYRVHINKLDAATKGKIQVSQDLMVDGKTPKELPMMVIK